jgi:hypothetical protein
MLIKLANACYPFVPNGKNFIAKLFWVGVADFSVAERIDWGVPSGNESNFRDR